MASTRTTRCSCRWCRTDELRSYIALGHELGISGWIHERNQQLRPADERELAWRATDTLEKLAGVRPVRVRTPSWDFSAATLGIIRELGLQYDSSQMADDEPYELVEDGEPTGVVEIPVEWIRDDAPYFSMDRYTAVRPLHSTARRAHHLARRIRPRVGRRRPVPADHAPTRTAVLEELIDYISTRATSGTRPTQRSRRTCNGATPPVELARRLPLHLLIHTGVGHYVVSKSPI